MSRYELPDARPLIPSKMYLPRLDPNTLSRPRLEVTLDQMTSIQLGVLRAPAGFGKTTLMAYWARRQASRMAWYSLDELDNDPTLFAHYLLTTLRKQLPELDADLERISDVMHLYDLVWLVGKLCSALEKLEQQIFLIFDNYHVIYLQKIHDAVSLLLQHQPWHLHIFLLTRNDPPISIAKLRLSGAVQEISADELKFSHEEAHQFLADRVALPQPATLVQDVLHRLNGWPAGLQIIALSAPTADSIAQFLGQFNGTHAHVLEYLAEEILSKQSESLQEFMLKSSVVDRFNADLATAVTNRTDSFHLIQTLEKLGLFITPLDDTNQWYRYHPFFVDFLRHQCQLKHPHSQIETLHRHAYQWWLTNDNLQEALHHVLQCHDESLIVTTLESHGWTLFEQGHIALIERSLARLPARLIAEHYKLALLKAWVSTTQADADALQLALSQVEQLIPSQPEDRKWRQVSAEIYALKAQMCAAVEDIDSAQHYADQALNHAVHTQSNATAVALSVSGEVLICQGQLNKALMTFQKAEKVARKVRSIQALLWAMAQQADILFYQGELVESYQHQTILFQVAGEHFLSQIPVMEFVHRRRAELCLEWLQLHEALQHCESGLNVIRTLEPHCQLPIYAIQAHIAIHQEQFDQAQRLLEQNSRIMKDTICHSDWISMAMQVQLLFWQKQDNKPAIRNWLSQQTIDADIQNHFHQKRALNIAFAMLSVGYWQPALGVLQHISTIANGHGYQFCELRCHLLRSWAHIAMDQQVQAEHALQHALTLAEPMRAVSSFTELPPCVIGLYAELYKSATLEPGVKRHLLRILELTKRRATQSRFQESIPEAVSTLALTAKEWQVLQMIGQGLSNEAIANTMNIAVSTVRSHIKHIYQKLGVSNRAEGRRIAQSLNYQEARAL